MECRDKDDGNKIGQGEVRDFATVARTLEATGLMLTTTGYTKGASDVAHDEGIDLGLLTAFEEHDWDGRVQQINVQLRMQIPSHIEATLGATDPGENLDMKVAVPGNTVIRRPDGMTDLAAVVRDALGVVLEDDGPVEIERELPEGTFIDLPTGSMAISIGGGPCSHGHPRPRLHYRTPRCGRVGVQGIGRFGRQGRLR